VGASITDSRWCVRGLAIAAAGLVLRLLIAVQPVDTLVAKVTPDDAYYYLQTAREIVHGGGASLDGIHSANGFHPLWLALLLPLGRLGRDGMVHGALALGAVIDTVTILALGWAVAALSRRAWVCLTAAAFYAFSPAMVFSATSGMESSVSLLCLVLLFGLVLRWEAGAVMGDRYWAALGVVAGLAALARTDNLVLIAPVFALFLFRAGRRLRPVLMAGGIAVVVLLPWFAWNSVAFQTPLQVSGRAGQLVAHTVYDPAGTRSFGDDVEHAGGLLKETFLSTIPDTYFFAKPVLSKPGPAARPVLGVAVAALLAAACVAAARVTEARRIARSNLPSLATFGVGFLALVAVHAGLRWHAREWYFVAAVPLAALFLALALEMVATLVAARPASAVRVAGLAPLAIVALLMGVQLYEGADTWDQSRYYWQPDILEAARWVRVSTPADARVVGLNVGLLAYFDGRTTTNLDGVMNVEAFHALQDRRLLAYVDDLQPDYLVDYDTFIFGLYGTFWGGDIERRLRPVASFGGPQTLFGPYRVYRFSQASAMLRSP
jgi:4-amino-4-deoxy-L-arabinose transferase-like glycosyltransferase